MRVIRRLPLAAGAATAAAAALAVSAFAGSDDACAQGSVTPRLACPGSTPPPPPAFGVKAATPGRAACSTPALLRSVGVRPSGRGLRVAFARRRAATVTVSVFQSAAGREVLGERLVFRASPRRGPVVWAGRPQGGRAAPRDGVFFVRISARSGRASDVRRLALRRSARRFRTERTFARRDGCGAVRAFKLERPAFGGRRNRAVGVSFRLAFEGRATVEVLRGGRVVRRLASAVRRGGVLHRVRLGAERLPRGRYEVRLRFGSATSSLFVRKV